jgi:hypothetical protein
VQADTKHVSTERKTVRLGWINLRVVVCMIVRMVNVVPRLPVSSNIPKAYRKPTPVTLHRDCGKGVLLAQAAEKVAILTMEWQT